jgi:hypothetical protein
MMGEDRREIESDVVLPAGMELVVPPRADRSGERPDGAAHSYPGAPRPAARSAEPGEGPHDPSAV